MTSVLAVVYATYPPYGGSALELIARILEIEKLTHDFGIGQQSFQQLQRVSALHFGDPRVRALIAVQAIFSLQTQGFRNKDLRRLLAQALGLKNQQITQGEMSYDLQRLRLHGFNRTKRRRTPATNFLHSDEGRGCSIRVPSTA